MMALIPENKTDFKILAKIIILMVILSLLWIVAVAMSCHAEEIGLASYYTRESCIAEGCSGRYASNNKLMDNETLTCAMRSRMFGRRYRITNLRNGRSIVVIHNDFGPSKRMAKKGRIVDLSRGAYMRIADKKDINKGTMLIKAEAINVRRNIR